MNQCLILFSDGGARGNPGPAAIAFVALDEKSEIVKVESQFIGVRTNNQAEYEALLMALNFAKDRKALEVICHLDSELVSKQLNGEYTVKNSELQKLWYRVQEEKRFFRKISFVNVPREHPQIQRADALLNNTLDDQILKPSGRGFTKSNNISCVKKENCMFVHVSVRTSNMKRSIDFYSKFLGLVLQSRREIKQTNAEIAFLQDANCKGCVLELTFYQDQKRFLQPSYEDRLFDHLAFLVSDIYETISEMKSSGVTITDEPFKINEQTTIAFIEDPDGTLIELIQKK